MWPVLKQGSAKREEKAGKVKTQGGRGQLESVEGSGTCAGMHVAVSGLSVGPWTHRVPRSHARAAAPTTLDATITGG